MIISGLQKISKTFGGNVIFDNLSLEIHDGDRVGLVGRNGSGKTTILKIIASEETVDHGNVTWRKGIKIGYLSQIPIYSEKVTGKDVLLSAFTEALTISNKMAQLEGLMASSQEDTSMNLLLAEYGLLQEAFVRMDGYNIETNVNRISNGLGLTELLKAPFASLSGGEKTKLGIGLLLLKKPDLLLLDEPTNHLDLAAVEWLEQFLKEYKGAVVIVSHDRYFLDEVITKIIDIEDGEVTVYHHNYSGFIVEKEKRMMVEFQAYQEQQKKIKKMKEAIKRLREWANQANPPNEGLHKRAKNMERALERLEKLKKPIGERKKIALQLDASDRSGKDAIMIKNVSKSFGNKLLFQEANLSIQYMERVALVGNNGSGKSTLLKLILKEITCDVGEIRVGSNVKIGYLSQQLFNHSGDDSVLDAFRQKVHVTEGDARHILASFLFYGTAVFRKVNQLSGGERMRLRLAQLMHQDVNLLILDEPTNHLDIDTREVLEEALEGYKGTILAVSHDRYLLNKLFEKTYWIENGTIHQFVGNYSWAKGKLQKALNKEKTELNAKPNLIKQKQQLDMGNKGKWEDIESKLMSLESQIHHYNAIMEEESDVELLHNLYEQQLNFEQERDKLYIELEGLLE